MFTGGKARPGGGGSSAGLPTGLSYNSDGGGAGADELRVSGRVFISAPAGTKALGVVGTDMGVYMAAVAASLQADLATKVQVATGDFIAAYTNNVQRMLLALNGDVVFGNAALATNATAGFVFVPAMAGPPSGTPGSYAGRVALGYDATNNKIIVYNGAWKQTVALT